MNLYRLGPRACGKKKKDFTPSTGLRDPQGPLKLLLLLVEKKIYAFFLYNRRRNVKGQITQGDG